MKTLDDGQLGKQLKIAIKDFDTIKISTLLEKKPDLVNYQDQDGNSPLHLAYLENSGKEDRTTTLLRSKGANEDLVNNKGFTPIEIVQGYELGRAIATNNIGTVRSLLNTNQKLINFTDFAGDSPLHMASYAMNPEIINLLLAKGADINTQNKVGDSPLHQAILSADTPNAAHDAKEIVNLLIQNRANVNIKNNKDETSLHVIAQSENKRTDIAELLIKKGADTNIQNINKQTAIDVALDSMEDYKKRSPLVDLLESNKSTAPLPIDSMEDYKKRSPLVDLSESNKSTAPLPIKSKFNIPNFGIYKYAKRLLSNLNGSITSVCNAIYPANTPSKPSNKNDRELNR